LVTILKDKQLLLSGKTFSNKTHKGEFSLKTREFTLFFYPYVPIFFAVWQKMRKFAEV